MKATTLYLIMEGRDDGPPIHHYSTTDENAAADYIDNRRAAFAESGIPGCPWYYINTTTTTATTAEVQP